MNKNVKNVIKTAQPVGGSYYYYGEVRYYAGLVCVPE